MSQPRPTSQTKTTSQSASATSSNAEVLRLRKELIQTKASLTDLQEELDEKTNLYLNAIKERDQYKERLNNASDNIKRVQDIVQQKVALALQDKTREFNAMMSENTALKDKEKLMDQTIMQQTNDKKILLDKIQDLNERLASNARSGAGGNDPTEYRRIDQIRAEKDAEARKVTELMTEINTLSNQMESFIAENRTLRQMANVPDNFGMQIDQVKLHDKDKIEDFKKLIKVLQDDNYKLEEERAKLKHTIKLQSMMYKSTDPSERYKNLTDTQMFTVDQFVLRLLQGDSSDPSDAYALRRENESLKAQMEALNSKGFDVITVQVQKILKDKQFGDNSQQLSKLIQDNEELRIMIAKLFEKGINAAPMASIGGAPRQTPAASQSGYQQQQQQYQSRDPRYRAPQPGAAFDNEILNGTSFKFENSQLGVVDKEGRAGVSASTAFEHAFLQLQLQECFEVVKRKDENLKFQQIEIDSLYKRVRSYVLTQDQLYKDFVRMERAFTKKEQLAKEKLREVQDQVLEEQSRVHKTEALIKSMQGGPDQSTARLIELTKQNSILDVNLLKLTRKYQSLEEQWKLLNREYHSKDQDMAEKDKHVMWRINQLKEWKARAIQQLKFQHEKLRIAVPMSEYDIVAKEVELAKQRTNDFIMRNAKLANEKANLQKKLRDGMEAEVNLRAMQESKEQALEEYEILKKRLEAFDPVFRFENTVFAKIAKVLMRAKISPEQAFAEFDASKDGNLSRSEFTRALEMMKVYDMTSQEIDVVWDSLDVDKSGSIDYKEFARKLEHYGVRNRSKEEVIITQMIDAVSRSKVKSLANLFELIDKSGRGFIDRTDFKDIFKSLNLNIDESELDRFMDNFWKTNEAGIDYAGFLRIFSKYQIKMDREQTVQAMPKVVSDNTVRLKKKLYIQMEEAFSKTGKKISDLFRIVDSDHSNSIGPEELQKMFQQMHFQMTNTQAQEIFASIDFDGNGSISLPEFMTDFRMVCASDVEELVRNEHTKRNEQQKIAHGGQGHLSKEQYQGVQAQTRIDMMHAEKKQLQRKLDTQMRIQTNTEKSLHEMQTQYNAIEKQLSDMTVTNYEMKERIISLETSARSSIKRDDADNLQVDNEKLKVELVETRAAMLSYKNMYGVIADQAKNLKLISERKKDEHDNLMNALREMQSEGVSQERLGKLYFIIMLSRWQEASVNKRYDGVLQEVRELRGELQNALGMCTQKELEHQEAENLLQKHNVDKEKLKQQVASSKGTGSSENQLYELNQRIHDMVDNLTESEDTLIKLRTKYREAQDLLDSSKAKAEHASDMLEKLQRARPNELSDKLVQLSEKQQIIRLNELRATRKSEELDEKVKYLSNLLKNKNDTMALLEEKASKAEAQVIKAEEQFRKRENERMRQFFFINKFDNQDETRTHSADIGAKLQRAGSMTSSGMGGARITAQQINTSQHAGQQDLTSAWTKPQIAHDTSDRINRLESQLQDATLKLGQKEAVIQRFEQWQIGDKYLSQDEVLKDAISEHRAKTSQANDKEQKEMAEAAYQTIKTLQDMLDNKNGAIRSKEEQITKMRQQMNQQREIDAQTICDLREQISFTGNTTLAKMQEIVSKHDVTQQVVGQRSVQNSAKIERGDVKEFTRQLQEKDHLIQQLRSRAEGHGNENALLSRKRDERLDEISQLKAELMRANNRNDIVAVNKKLERLVKERKDQDETIKALNRAIDAFKHRMTQYESEKLTLTDQNEVVKKKEQYGEMSLKKEIETLKNKVTLVESSRDKKNEDIKTLKVKVSELEAEKSKQGADHADVSAKYQTALKALEDERRNKGRVVAELQGYKDEQKIGGNVGGKMSYEQVMQRNKELEQDNKILECQKKTVVCYNKDVGSFEYIGEPRPLDYNTEITQSRELISKIQAWLQSQSRLTVGPIFRSLDKQNIGDLSPQLITQGLEKIGIVLKPTEMQLLKTHLDVRNSGYLKIEPLIRELQGVRTVEFIIAPMQKLARLVDSRDFNRIQFRGIVDPKHEENLTIDSFTKSLMTQNSSDFTITAPEIEEIFKQVANVQKIGTGQQMQVTKLIEQLFDAVKAVVIERIREQLKRSGKYLVDLLVKHDTDKDGLLTYMEFENLLLDLPVSVKAGIFNEILIGEMLDVGKRQSKISFDIIKWYLGGGSAPLGHAAQDTTLDMQPGRDRKTNSAARGNLSEAQFQICRAAARKIVSSNVQLMDILNAKDFSKEGMLSNEEIITTITDKRIVDLQPSELNLLVTNCDKSERGFIVIPSFVAKVTELAQETPQESQMRKFAGTVGRQGVNLMSELTSFETQHSGRLDILSFKKAVKHMALGLTDAEIDTLFTCAEVQPGLLDTKAFVNQVAVAAKTKAPAVSRQAVKPDSKVQSKVGAQGAKNQDSSQAFDSWEIEKKYKRNLEALKQEIEDRNREIQVARKEVKDSNERVQKIESEYRRLEGRLVDRNAKPPRQMNSESEHQHSLDEIQKLKDEIYHMQQVNQALQKVVQVDLKAELGKTMQEKEILEAKLKTATEKVRAKTIEINQLVGKPMDQLARREEREELRQKQVEELTRENTDMNEAHRQTLDKLFSAEERLLDLKFEKETFDLQYARLQKRITDLENYKLQSSQLSAVMKNQYQSEIDKIRDDTEKLRGDALSRQPGDTVKLRALKSRSAAELESVVEQLKRVVEKQRMENEALRKANDRLETLTAKGTNEPALRQKIDMLERVVHSYEMTDVKTGEKDMTIKKLVFANKTLREDLQQEIERFNLLQNKYKEMLIKYNIATKENTKNQRSLFTMTTGAQMEKYENFLDDQGEFNPKKSRMTEDPGTGAEEDHDDLNDSLNQINRVDARGYGYSN